MRDDSDNGPIPSARAGRFGTLPDGRRVTRHILGAPDGLRLGVLDLGGVVQSLWVPAAEGPSVNVVLGGADLGVYVTPPEHYFGGVIGRFANRIAGARLPLDGASYPLVANEGRHSLHGGPDGFHRRLWDVEHVDDRRITLALVSPDGDQGFPGRVRVRVSYEIRGPEVRIDYQAESDAPTVVNLTQHAHLNLAGEGSGSIGDHLLSVAARRYTPVDADLVPTGVLADVAGTDLDLREPRALRDGPRGGYDHNYVLDHTDGRPAAVLGDPGSGRVLEVETDRPGLQVYTCQDLDGSHVGSGGRPYRAFAGVALETQGFPDAPHHEGEDGWPSTVLQPGETFTSRTTWRFRTGPPLR